MASSAGVDAPLVQTERGLLVGVQCIVQYFAVFAVHAGAWQYYTDSLKRFFITDPFQLCFGVFHPMDIEPLKTARKN